MRISNYKLVGILGSLASIVGLIVFFLDDQPPTFDPITTVTIGNDNAGNNQVIVGEMVTVNTPQLKHQGEVSSANELLAHSGRITSLPPDILAVINPSTSLNFVTDVLGKPNREYETNGAQVYQYTFSNASLGVMTVEGSQVNAVYIRIQPDSNQTKFHFPNTESISFDLLLGVSTWDDALRDLGSGEIRVTHTGRWTRAFVSAYYGNEGKYRTYYAGSECTIPNFHVLDDVAREEGIYDDAPARITSGGQTKLTYLVLADTHDIAGNYSFIPICY